MKQLINFRLHQEVLFSLKALEDLLHRSKTQIVEEAILHYAEEKKIRRTRLLSLAGILSEKEADDMLQNIKQSKNRKELVETL